MKCNNCGSDNRDDSSHCGQCRAVLPGYASPGRPTVGNYQQRTSPSTPNKPPYAGAPTIYDKDLKKCDACGYRMMPGSSVCPNCGKDSEAKPQIAGRQQCPKCRHNCAADALFCSNCGFDMQGFERTTAPRPKTITPWDMKPANSCRLKAIPNENESIQQGTLRFAGDRVVLNRANTEEANLTITSKEQAVLVCENGKWYIQDKSEHKTTFIHTKEMLELRPGDIIMLGNRRFEFEADKAL
ncbi:MAG: zinc ribbon domain-containing protein [Tannerellaceae bacterium]|nr:zinc ribbon domain-containing protein [Tannerellaceae bacterium]